MIDNKACVICKKGEEEERLSTVTKGLQSLTQSSEILNLEQSYDNLKNAKTFNEIVVYIHSGSRKNIQNAFRTKERKATGGHKTGTSMEPKNPTRRSCCEFEWQVHCFIYAKIKKLIKDMNHCQLIVPF